MSIFADMLAKIYASPIGVSATLIVNDVAYPIPAIDETQGIAIGGDDLGVQTLSPAAHVRISDLATALCVSAADLMAERIDVGLDGATLRINGANWRITSHRREPSPDGPGEYLLLLEATANPCGVI